VNESLHNIVWHALVGAHAHFAAGAGDARRYQRGLTDLIGFADAGDPDFTALRPHCDAGEAFYCLGWTGCAPAGWSIEREARIVKMVWEAPDPPAPAGASQPVRLRAEHQARAQALAALTQPGPFGARTLELGEYFGIFDGDALVAMAGERMHAGALREISAVCTHPAQQGRGLARRLTLHLLHRQRQRGETPFLHVLGHNARALDLYARLGFSRFAETTVRIVRVR
jgi:GNAT superfamily N-acetyltransferase